MDSKIQTLSNDIWQFFKSIKGSDYMEFQFADNTDMKTIFKDLVFGKEDSLYVSSLNISNFMEHYREFFDNPFSPDGSDKFCYFGLNYYDKQKTIDIINKIIKTDIGCKKLLVWLNKAYTKYNGFYILGI